MSEKKDHKKCSKYEITSGRLKCRFLKSNLSKYIGQKLNDPIYSNETGHFGLLYIHVKKGREPPRFVKSYTPKHLFH